MFLSKYMSFTDVFFNGMGVISGKISRLGVYGTYHVLLFSKKTKTIIKDTWSDAEGNYSFNNIAPTEKAYFIIAFDENRADPVNAAISDYVTPESVQ